MAGNDEGLSTQKKVVAGAALGVAIPAAIGMAKKLKGGGESDGEPEPSAQTRSPGTRSRGSSTSGTTSRSRSAAGRSRSTTSRSSSKPRTTAKRASTAASRTKEQLYREAKRLKVEGRSRMTKAQLERAVGRARG